MTISGMYLFLSSKAEHSLVSNIKCVLLWFLVVELLDVRVYLLVHSLHLQVDLQSSALSCSLRFCSFRRFKSYSTNLPYRVPHFIPANSDLTVKGSKGTLFHRLLPQNTGNTLRDQGLVPFLVVHFSRLQRVSTKFDKIP